MDDAALEALITALPLREQPTQKRSRRTVIALLGSARAVVEGQGVAAMTTASVAEEAAVPIGTVYRYFRDRQELIDALVAWHRYEMDGLLLDTARSFSLLDWERAIRTLIAEAAAFARARPTYLPLRALASTSSEGRALGAGNRWIDGILASPALQASGIDVDAARVHVTVAVAGIQGVIPQTYAVDEDDLEAIVTATARMVVLYVRDVAREHGLHLP